MRFQNRFNWKTNAAVLILLVFCQMSYSQNVTGPTTVGAYSTQTYEYAAQNVVLAPNWTIAGGTLASSGLYGGTTTYYAIVQWGAAGSGTVTFKNLTLPLSSLNVTISAGSSSTGLSNENYVHAITPRIATTDVTQLDDDEKLESVSYFDGLGRSMQSIGIRAGGNEEDIITHAEYDALGRQAKEYMPYAVTSNGGSYATLGASAAISFYNTSKYENTTNPFSEKAFESSPLSRVLKQAAPGADWAMGQGHEIEFQYLTNARHEVKNYTVTLTFANNTYTPTLVLNGAYDTNEIYRTITKDENHSGTSKNHTTEEFKDKLGRVILKRTYTDSDLNGNGTIGSGESQVPHDTYYVYDDYGNLTYVLPPKSEAQSGLPNATELSELCYQYKYDNRNRLVEKKIPGKGWEYIVYNTLDQPILTQDANLKAQNRWLFTKYDAFGRIAYTGSVNSNSNRVGMQNTANNPIYQQYESKVETANTLAGTTIYYNNVAIPKVPTEIYTINYYDDYTFDTDNLILPSSVKGQSIINHDNSANTQTLTKGLATGSKVRVLGTNDWTTTITGYDAKGRPIYVASYNDYLETNDIVMNTLDFTGKVLNTETIHNKVNSDQINVQNEYTYDSADRMLTDKQRTHALELTGQTGVSVEGNVITKTYTANSWNAGCASSNTISGDGYASFMADDTSRVMVGFSQQDNNVNYTSIQYAMYARLGIIYVYEGNGTSSSWKFTGTAANNGLYTFGDVLSVHREGSTITYRKNGDIVYTSSTLNNAPLLVDSSIYTPNKSIYNLQFYSADQELIVENVYDELGQLEKKHVGGAILGYTDKVNVNIDVSTNTITNTSSGWGNSGLATEASILSGTNGYVQFSPLQTNKSVMVGLSSSNTNAHFNTINYALFARYDGHIRIYENGSLKGTFGTYAVGDNLKVERIGNTVFYKVNDVVKYTSAVASSGALLGDVAFASNNASIKNLIIKSDADGLQQVDYTYNIRGWLKDINNVSSLGSDLFGFKIKYNDPVGGTALFNGNIAQTTWKTLNTDNSTKFYTYSYDALNRLTEALDNTGKYSLYNVAYDKNGNLLTLLRKGHIVANPDINTPSHFGNMDNLTYTYYNGGNFLVKVDDDFANDTYGFKDGLNTDWDYGRDANGNSIRDKNKNITNISYNHLNLPTIVNINSDNIQYIYDATGVKQKKIVSTGATTEYAGNYIYENSALKFFSHPEGYVDVDNNVFEYVYQYKDHLGNIRLSYADSNNNGSVNSSEIIEENNYYPFGLKHKGYNNVINGTDHPYGFGGKEENDELGLGWIDVDARNYDPALGRWMNLDPLSEQMRRHSPYNYAFNNPLRFTDPDGMAPFDVHIEGELADESFKQLQSSVEGKLTLTRDTDKNSETYGKVTATVNEGVELEEGGAAETLLNATKDSNTTVTINAQDGFQLDNGKDFIGGAFGGSKVNEDGTVDATQTVNPKVQSKLDSHYERGEGVGTLHEVIEGYVGAKESPGASSSDANAYDNAHNKASAIDSRYSQNTGENSAYQVTGSIGGGRTRTTRYYQSTNKKGQVKPLGSRVLRTTKKKKG